MRFCTVAACIGGVTEPGVFVAGLVEFFDPAASYCRVRLAQYADEFLPVHLSNLELISIIQG